MAQENGTFLIRYSDSELGGITIAWVAPDPQSGGMSQDFTHHIFNNIALFVLKPQLYPVWASLLPIRNFRFCLRFLYVLYFSVTYRNPPGKRPL